MIKSHTSCTKSIEIRTALKGDDKERIKIHVKFKKLPNLFVYVFTTGSPKSTINKIPIENIEKCKRKSKRKSKKGPILVQS